MRFGIVVFPGTWSDGDCYHQVVDVLGYEADYVWHRDRNLQGYDCIILPGGFSYGDYLRPGAVAGLSPVMEEVRSFAKSGGPVIGICNGFQVLCEAGLLPGALLRNSHLQYRCQWTNLRTERVDNPFSAGVRSARLLRKFHSRYFAQYRVPLDSSGAITEEANPNGAANNSEYR